MKDRLITAAGALIALVVLYAMFFQRSEPPVTRPVSTETGRNGYAAVFRWLDGAGVHVASLRERYDRLIELDPDAPRPPYPDRGNLLITTMPHLLPVRSHEHESLKAWIRSGNTLLILAALNDTPSWEPEDARRRFLDDLQIMTGLRFEPRSEPARPEASAPIERGSRVELVPVGGHPLTDGVGILRGFSDARGGLWRPVVPDSTPALLLRLATERSSGSGAAWQRAYGNGQIVVVASGTMLTNHLVAESDAATFLANIVRHHVEPEGTVIFDDMHQGLSSLYDAAAFYGDPRLHRTLWFLLGAWLVYLLGSSNRLAPAARPRASPRQRHFLEAVGGLLARRLDRRDAGLRLLESWFDEVRRARGLRGEAPPWEALRATPMLDRRTYERLRRDHETLSKGRPVDLVRLQNTLRRAREAIG